MKKPTLFIVFPDGSCKGFKATLLPDRYVQIGGWEPVPFEDFGDCLLTWEDITVEEAHNQIIALA
jgi:hypothetical protein